MNEKLSAFVDNELSQLEERQLLARLEGDQVLRSTWGRYHIIRAAMRKELNHVAPAGLSGAVANAVDLEPRQRHRLRLIVNIGKAVGGLAIAASVATIAILNVPSPLGPSKESATIAQTGGATPTTAASTAVSAQARPSAAASSLNGYLAEHNEFAPTAGMGNMLPYVRTVNHESNQ
jgi:sigma-E factor negative regulatory protein RseA